MVIDPKFTKKVDSFLSLQTERNTLKTLFDSSFQFTLADRDLTSDKKGNYFISFNLPQSPDQLPTGSTVSRLFPELQQLNVDKIIICQIPPSDYSEFIDGRTINISLPQSGGTSQTSMSSVTLISSTYTSDKILKSETSPLLGDNVAFLFSDALNRPYSGSVVNEIGISSSLASNTSWNPNPNNFLERPSAIAYSEVKRQLALSGISTDLRTTINYSVPVPNGYPDNRTGYTYDIPVGFVVLDMGLAVITHKTLVDNFPWNSGFTASNDQPYVDDGQVSGKTNIYFTGVTSNNDEAAQIVYQDINTSFKTSVVAVAMPREFYISNNPTWNRSAALASINEQTGIISFDPVSITEIGLYNELGELIAVAKLDRPVEKGYTDVLTFVLDIEM
jgi:hypothetical protein